MSEGNGQQESGNERLDRIERALELILNDHIEFREEHKLLLTAQVQMQGGLEDLRKTASNEKQRLWLDVMSQAAHKRLGLTAQADATAKRIADNPERLDAQHGKNAVALIAEVRQSAAQMEALRKMLRFYQ